MIISLGEKIARVKRTQALQVVDGILKTVDGDFGKDASEDVKDAALRVAKPVEPEG